MAHRKPDKSTGDFEFTVFLSPHKSPTTAAADELFYNGRLVPLHQTLLSSSSSSSNSTAAGRRSSDSTSSFSAGTSAIEDDNHVAHKLFALSPKKKPGKHISFNGFPTIANAGATVTAEPATVTGFSVKRMSASAKEKLRKYLKKLSPWQGGKTIGGSEKNDVVSHSFSGNLWHRRRRSCASSCPSSIGSSPNYSGVLCRNSMVRVAGGYANNSSSMEELQSAIQGAIAHCKNSMTD